MNNPVEPGSHQLGLEMRGAASIPEKEFATESRTGYLEAYDFAPIGYLALDQDGRVMEMNKACALLLAVENRKLIDRHFIHWIEASDRNRWRRQLRVARRSGETHGCELKLRRDNGEFLHARLDYRQESVDGRSSTRIFVTDITRQMQLEEEISEWRSKPAELHAMHVFAQTAASIAHELNQPLLAISSYADAADLLLKNGNPDMKLIGKAINGCQRESSRARSSMRELLDLFRVEVSPAKSFDLRQEIERILHDAKVKDGLAFEHVMQVEDGLRMVRANCIHLRKVLLNLLHNAVEAMAEAAVGQPVIAVNVCARPDENAAQITVQDNGPGVREIDLPRLFEPFFTTKTKGTGMGLAVSRSLIEENGGRLWVAPQDAGQLCLYPQELKGAVFHFTLPFIS
ncbi:MAG: PAS domain S-box protein [Gammaproteobacteria bacterium]|nr:PAS domain S-box protein [Gammaproteobacteria bacterium]